MMPPMMPYPQQPSVQPLGGFERVKEKAKALYAKTEKHPLIDKLSDGFVIYR